MRPAGRLEQSFAPASGNPSFSKSPSRDVREQVRVDRIVAKRGLVAAEAETEKPPANVHVRAPHGLGGTRRKTFSNFVQKQLRR
jgi:hypothetical protein